MSVLLVLLVLAVRLPDAPAATGPPESTSSEPYRPDPVPTELSRTDTPPGAVHAVVAEDLSAQYVATQSPAAAVTEALTCVAVESLACALAVTGPVVSTPE